MLILVVLVIMVSKHFIISNGTEGIVVFFIPMSRPPKSDLHSNILVYFISSQIYKLNVSATICSIAANNNNCSSHT